MKVLAFSFALLAFAPFVAADTKLVEFTADWCPPCRQMAPVVAGLEREGYRIERVNVDRDPETTRQFHIHEVPTFVVLTDGRETARWDKGLTTAEHLKSM